MISLYTNPTTGKQLTVEHVLSFNLKKLMDDYKEYVKEQKPETSIYCKNTIHEINTPAPLAYHDVCVGILSNGTIVIGESCVAYPADYREEIGTTKAREDMLNKAYALRAFLIKNENANNPITADNVSLSNVNNRVTMNQNLKYNISRYVLDLAGYLSDRYDIEVKYVPIAIIGYVQNTFTTFAIGLAESDEVVSAQQQDYIKANNLASANLETVTKIDNLCRFLMREYEL